VTSTVSLRPDTSSVTSTRTVSLTPTLTDSLKPFMKPLLMTSMRYVPGPRLRMRKTPSFVVVASRETPLAMFVTMTTASATTAFWLSVMVPWMALLNCAAAGRGARVTASRKIRHVQRNVPGLDMVSSA
jgi:hypothetical protein